MKTSTIALAGLAFCATPAAQAVGIISVVDILAGGQTINQFDSATPLVSAGAAPISGLGVGERILGIDYRPATGQLYALGSGSTLYTVNVTTGLATALGAAFTTPLSGTSFGFDFNPMIDRIRIVSDNDQNLVVNPDTGAIQAVATALFYGVGDVNNGANPNVIDSAYNNNFVGTGTTQLYGIDSALNILVTQANNAGTLGTVGALGFDVTDVGGFDIAPGNTAYAALTVAGVSSLYTINLATGGATNIGALSGNVSALAVVPEPSSLALLGLGAIGLLSRRRRG